jgi:hypothetical protein
MNPEACEVLDRARARLDRLELYPRPVRTDRVRVLTAPLLFRLPRMRRYAGYALWRTILLKRPPRSGLSDDLVTHELCHIWQMQNRPFHVLVKFLTTRYRENPYEREARGAVERTRAGSPVRESSAKDADKEGFVETDPRDPRAREGADPLADAGGSDDLEDVREN